MADRESGAAGLRVLRPADCVADTSSGAMTRQAAVSATTVGAAGLWLGHVQLGPGLVSAAHHHGDSESAIYVVSGRARFAFGPDLATVVEAVPGDVVWVPPQVVHVEMNASDHEPVVVVVSRSSAEGVTVDVPYPEGWTPPPAISSHPA